MEKKEFKIGEVFQCGLIKLKCVEEINFCKGCFLNDITSVQKQCKKLVGECESLDRKDGEGVIFVKVDEQ